MGKKDEKQTRQRAQTYAATTNQRSQENILGSPNSPYGAGGLATDRYQAKMRRDTAFGDAQNGLRAAQTTGGYDADRLDHLRTRMTGLGDTGGYDPGVSSRITAGYSKFADDGGFSPMDEANFRRRATSGVSGIYNVLGEEAERRRNTTGGLGTGGDMSRMARQLSQEQARASTGAEVDLATMKRSGQLSGLEGLRGSEGDFAAGRREGAGMEAGLEGSVAQGKMQANAGMSNLYNTATGEVSDMGREILAQYGLADASSETQLRVLAGLADQPGPFDNAIRVGQTVGGIAGAFNH